MKYSLIATVLLGFLTLTVYQNCSPSHNGDGTVITPFDVSKVYPYYDAKPEFINNVQLTKAFKDGNVWRYQFVASAVHVDTPDSNINVNIQIYDQDGELLCLSTQATMNSSSNHIVINNCNSSVKATLVKINVFVKLATQSAYPKEPTSKYVFPMGDIE